MKNINYPIKLIRYLGIHGTLSRRKYFELLKNGRVKVNGVITTDTKQLVNKEDIVTVANEKLSTKNLVYIKLNKPEGYVCTNSDPFVDKKTIDLINIPDKKLFNVGRLDKNSQGLIIYTNDGKYASKISHPANEIQKTYIIKVKNKISNTQIKNMMEGLSIDGEVLKALSITPLSEKEYKIILNEGKKREIRRLIQYYNNRVLALKRTAIGKLELGNLNYGKWNYLNDKEIKNSLQNPD